MALRNDPCLKPEQHQLRDLISEVSERCYAAGWLGDAEFSVWRLATEGGTWGDRDAAELASLLTQATALSKRLGVWIIGSSRPGCNNEAVSLDEWSKSVCRLPAQARSG